MLGTVPDSWMACIERAATAVVTPGTFSTVATADCGNVMRVPVTKKSCEYAVPGGPSFERSVSTDWLLFATAALSMALWDAP